MRRLFATALTAGLVVGGSAAAALAQDEPDPGGSVQTIDLPVAEIDTSGYPEITAVVTLPEELAAENLGTGSFFVAENGEARPATVRQLPVDQLAVALVLDRSGSMRGAPLSEAKSAVNSFVDVMPDAVGMALVTFGDESTLVVAGTTDQDVVKQAVSDVVAAGETAMYDGLVDASELLNGLTGVRRSVILLTDGADTASQASLEAAIIALLRSEAELIAVSLESPETDTAALERLQIATQGLVVPANDPAALEGIFDSLAADLVNQYEISFTSEAGGTTDLTLAVRGERYAAVSTSELKLPDSGTAPPPTQAPVPSTTVVPVPIAAPEGVLVAVPWYQSASGLTLGAIAIFVGIFGILLVAKPAKASGGVRALRGIRMPRADASKLAGIADRASGLAERAIDRTGRTGRLRLLIDQSGLNLRVGEFGVIALAAALAGYFAGNLLMGFIGGIAVAAAGAGLPFLVVSTKASRRAAAFSEQLADSLQLIAGGLKAGFGLMQSIDAMTVEAPEPTATEFNRIRLEVQLGRSLEEAIDAAANRVRSEDLRMAGEAIEIHQSVGGDLAELLERVSATIREREMVRRQIQVLSAEGKLSAFVLLALPIVIALLVRVIAPNYLSVLTETTVGKVMIVGGIGLMVIGLFWIRRIIRLQY